jgi:nitric oxide reductase NorQ protein
MPYCIKCGNDIKDAGWKMHQFMCSGKSMSQPIAQSVKIEPKVVVVSEVKPTEVKAQEILPEAVSCNSSVSEITYPTADPNFMVSKSVADALHYADEISKDEPTNILITGHAGCGKTSVASQFAAITHRPLVKADFGAIQEPQQLFQTTHLIKGDGNFNITETKESAFITGIETPNCVVVLDELNRVENERCLNPLMPILDGSKGAWIDELRRKVVVAPGVIFIATINEGALFCGVTSLDGALRDRFAEIFLDYLPAEYELIVIKNKTGVSDSIAGSLAQFAFAVRTTPTIEKKVSTRQMLRAAKYYSKGAPLWHAVELAIGNYNDLEWRQQVLEVFSLNIKDEVEYNKWRNKKQDESNYINLV